MSYTALYRKLRPKTFNEVIGQQFIIKTLVNQIVSDRASHAYLFCGTRGTGKTSVAKVFAKALNCTNNINGQPCNECESCISISKNRNLNVQEIDAASNNGVENIRDIKEEVKYPPTSNKYKIYIIDEVHMLSIGAFNALLKTLEEPPKHVVFILATTDPQKIPSTVISRCQRFDFRRITSTDMFNALKGYCEDEKINIEDEALKYICITSDGAMRDALSILDMSVSFYFDTKITHANILELVGSVDNEVLDKMANAINNYDSSQVIEIITEVVNLGRDVSQFITELILHFRNMLVSLSVGINSNTLDYSEENIEKMKKQAEIIGQDKLLLFINTFADLQNKVKYVSNQRILLEVSCIKLCTNTIKDEDNSLLLRIQKLENEIKNSASNNFSNINNVYTQNIQNIENTQINNINKIINKAISNDVKQVRENWKAFTNTFAPLKKAVLQTSHVGYIEKEGSEATVLIVTNDETTAKLLYQQENLQLIKQKLQQMFNKEFNLQITHKEDYDKQHIKTYGQVDTEETDYKTFTDKVNFPIIIEE